jgi:hypothetical protein
MEELIPLCVIMSTGGIWFIAFKVEKALERLAAIEILLRTRRD